MIKKLKEVAKINEKTISSKSNLSTIYYIDIASVENGFVTDEREIKFSEAPTRARRIIRNNDILLSTVRPNLRHYVYIQNVKENTIASTGFAVISSKTINPRFLYYFLTSNNVTNYLSTIAESHTSTYPSFPPEILEELDVPYPSRTTQDEIADILGSFDDKIELNHQMNQTLEDMARAIFKSWFVDFDPVYAKMESRDYPLPPEIIDLFPDELEESELGLIPKGWSVSTIGEEVQIVGGGTPSTINPEFWENGIYDFATPKDLSDLASPILIDTERKVTEKGLKKISSGLLPPGTLLMSSRAPVGYLAIAEIPVCINQGFIAMKCNKTLSNYYMLNWAKTYMDDIKGRASGTTFAEISKANFRPMKILVPNKDLIWIFEQRSGPLFEKILNNLKQNLIVTKLRDVFLLKFFNDGAKF